MADGIGKVDSNSMGSGSDASSLCILNELTGDGCSGAHAVGLGS
jgi:hypothetical protein